MRCPAWLGQPGPPRWQWAQGWSRAVAGVAGAPQVSYGRVEGAWSNQDRKPEEHTKASESAMAVMDWLSQNRNQ